MMNRNVILAAALLGVLAAGCGGGNGAGNGIRSGSAGYTTSGKVVRKAAETEAPALRNFPMVNVPAVYSSDTDAAQEYVLEHYWDEFFRGEGETTPAAVLGVADPEIEQALANYIQILEVLKAEATPDDPALFRKAVNSVRIFFSRLETRQKADTASRTYLRMTEMVSKYLYDPNSPMRDEDFYLPFVEGVAASPCTRDDLRTAARYELSQCRRNGFGQTAKDFRFKSSTGKTSRLHAVQADYTMLFFSNPGCSSCKQIIDDIKDSRFIQPMIEAGRLAIVNIYIDEEVQKWREYLPNYPKEWINGYDYTFSLRDSDAYDIRAIPSLYLLDSGKRVLMKDAPTDRVLTYLENIYIQ